MHKEGTTGTIYVISHPDGYQKVGATTGLDQRFTKVQLGSPYSLTITTTLQAIDLARTETRLQGALRDHHHRGEWYDLPEPVLQTLHGRDHLTPDMVGVLFSD